MGIECLIAHINKLPMHYGYKSNVKLELKILLEYMIYEMGISDQPLQESYRGFESWITHSWLKSVLENATSLVSMCSSLTSSLNHRERETGGGCGCLSKRALGNWNSSVSTRYASTRMFSSSRVVGAPLGNN